MLKRFATRWAIALAIAIPGAAAAQTMVPYFRFMPQPGTQPSADVPAPGKNTNDVGSGAGGTGNGGTGGGGAGQASGGGGTGGTGTQGPGTSTLAVATPANSRARTSSPFRLPLSATGGNGALTWVGVGDALPAGLYLDQDGIISGTPSAVSRSGAVQVLVRDASGQAAETSPFAIDVRPAPSVSYADGVGQVGTSLSIAPSVTDAYGAQAWSLAGGSLPPGLGFDPASGTVSGVPTATGTFGGISLSVRDGDGLQGTSNAFTVTVSPGPALAYGSTTIDKGPTYEIGPASTGLTPPLTYSLATRSGAPNCTGPAADGTLSCSQTSGDGGVGTYTVTARDANGRTATSSPVSVTNGTGNGFSLGQGGTAIFARSGQPFDGSPASTANAPGPVTFAALDPLPAGFSLNTANGSVISAGVPSGASGSFRIAGRSTVGRVTQTSVATYSVASAPPPKVSAPTQSSSGPPIQGSPYSASGSFSDMFGGSSVTPGITATGLPSGLNVTASGSTYTISGIPTQAGTFPVTVTATDPADGAKATTFLTLDIGGATATADSTGASVVEGDGVSFTVRTNLPNPTWTLTGNPAWLTGAPSGDTLRVSGTSVGTPQSVSYQVVATATGNGVSAGATVPVSVSPSVASFTPTGPVRPGVAFSVPVKTTMAAAGSWSSTGIGGAGGVTFANPSAHQTTASATAPANGGTSPVTSSFEAAYTASASPSSGSAARSVVSASVTVYPSLSVGTPSDATFTAGSAFTLNPPAIGGGYGTPAWSVWSGGQDITATFGQAFPGLSFDRATGRIAGLARSGASARLTYRVHDDGKGSDAMAADASSAQFTLSGGDATASATTTQANLSAGGGLDSTVTTSLDSPTWNVTGAPAWVTATPNGNTLKVSGTAPPQSQDSDDTIVVTASNGSASTVTKIPVHVNGVTASLSAVRTRTKRSFTTLLTTNYPAGNWSMQPIDVNFSRYANGAFAGTALDNPGPSTASRTMTAVLPGGSGTIAQASAPLVVYPDLALAAPAAQTGVTGTPMSFGAPQPSGVMGTLAWKLFVDGGSEVSGSLGSICKGMAFDASGGISGTPQAPCAVNLRYVATDTVTGAPELNENAASQAFTLAVADPRVSIVATPGNTVMEGDGIVLEAGSNIKGRTFSSPNAPAWLRFAVRDSDGAYVAYGPTPDVSADTTFPVTVYATSDTATSNNTINIVVKAASATITQVPTLRVGQAFTATVTETMAAAGAWSASSPTNDIGYSGVSNGVLSGSAPASVGTSAVTRTLKATYTASAPPVSGPAAKAEASTSFTVYPALAFSAAPQAQYGAVGTQLNAFAPPSVIGRSGTLFYGIWKDGAEITSKLGDYCPGLGFNASNGQISGRPTGACVVTMNYSVFDDGAGVQNLQASAASGSFQLSVTNSIPNAFSFPPASNVAGGTQVASQAVALTGMTAPGPVSVSGGGGYAVRLGVNGGALSTSIPASVPANATLVVGLDSYPGSDGGSRSVTVNVSGVSATFTATTADTTPNAFGWTSATAQQPNAYVGSNTITISGLTAPATLTISGPNSPGVSINGATWNRGTFSINNGDTVAVAQQAAATANTTYTAYVTIGGVTGSFSVTTGTDNPNPFNCSSGTNSVYPANGGQEYYCDVYLTGMQVPAAWSVSGQYNRVYTDATGWTTASSGSVPANGRIVLAVLAPAGTNGGTNAATMRVGNQQQTLTVRTGDTYPNDFNFANIGNQPLNAFVGSNAVTITGIDQPTPVQTTNNGYVSINGGGWTQSGTIYNGQSLSVAMTTSGSYDTSVGMSVLVGGSGGVLKNWLTTTGPVPCDGTGNSAQNATMYYHYAPDVQAAGQLAAKHWVWYGYYEGRRSCYQTPVCDGYGSQAQSQNNINLYYWFNPDVAAAGIDAYTHWVNYGQHEHNRVSCWQDDQGH